MKQTTLYKYSPPIALVCVGVFQITSSPLALYGFVSVGLFSFVVAFDGPKRWELPVMLVGAYLAYCVVFESVKNLSLGTVDNILIVMANVGLAVALRRHRPSQMIALTVYFGILIWFLIYMAGGYGAGTGGVPDAFMVDRSRNHISVLFLFMASFVLIATGPRSKAAILTCAMTLVVAVVAIGRSGIVASLLLLAGVGLSQWNWRSIARLGVVALALGVRYVVAGEMQLLPEKAITFEKFQNEIGRDPRVYILRRYFSELSIGALISGFKTHEHARVAGTLTLHNSYLALHFRFGALGLLLAAATVLLAFRGLFSKVHRVQLSAFVLLALLVRGMTDVIFLPNGLFDFILIYHLVTIYNLDSGRSGVSVKHLSNSRRWHPIEPHAGLSPNIQ